MSRTKRRSNTGWPGHVERATMRRLLEEARGREELLRQLIRRMESRYECLLEELEARLTRGEGPEHLDWEDSIEWRNAVEALDRTRALQCILEWLVNSLAPSPVS